MSQQNNLGKLIISKSNDYYETFHDLKLILVKGDRNKIIIDQKVSKLIINGNNNTIQLEKSGDIRQTILRGNNNIIIAKYLYYIYNKSDYGKGNITYVKKFEEGNGKQDSEDEKEEHDSFAKREEEEEKRKIISIERPIDFNLNGKVNEDCEEDYDEEDIFSYLGCISGVPIYDIEYEIERQLQREREKELFRASVAGIVFENSKSVSLIDPDSILNELIDIRFKNVSKGIKEDNEKCVICYDNFEDNESVKMTSCFHIFHFKCIKKWIERKQELSEKPDCPICRRDL